MPQAVSENNTVTTSNAEKRAVTPVVTSESVSNEESRQGEDTLPQTGNSHNNTSEILGLAALGLTGILVGGATKRRRKN
ncbi:LPXTG cell wall anchor domain-containing protein [Limosilactobacillus balticus]|nr:LPXTG cell wall anchor domain-containing protein [Limosilactobacillus balticus]